jgi:predicted transcriptional regulator
MRLKQEEMKEVINTLGMTLEEFSEKCGVRPETVYHWIKGKNRIPAKIVRFTLAMLKHMELEKNALATGNGK